jgi:hypothetical protein
MSSRARPIISAISSMGLRPVACSISPVAVINSPSIIITNYELHHHVSRTLILGLIHARSDVETR